MHISPLIGHRGLAALAPENTLAAIHSAYQHGISWVELDASLLGDQSAILWHDDSWQRCSNHGGWLCDSNATDCTYIDAGYWFSPDFANEPVATVTDALQLLSKLNMGLNLELKFHPGSDRQRLVSTIHTLIQQHWYSQCPVLISSFDQQLLREYRRYDVHQPLGLLFEALPANWPQRVAQFSPVSLHCNWHCLTWDQAHAVRAAGLLLVAYTCNDISAARTLWQMGVNSIISDCPHHLISPLPPVIPSPDFG